MIDPALVVRDAPPLDHETTDHKVRLEDGRVTVSMKAHHATEQEARASVASFFRSWELDQALRHGGRRLIGFKFKDTRTVDLDTGTVLKRVAHWSSMPFEARAGTITRSGYPPPPVDFVASPNVETLWNRYERYVEGREPLAGMAYACFTFIIKVVYNGRTDASKTLNISDPVLKELGRLAGAKGERKYPTAGPYSGHEKAWLEAAIRLLIRRVGAQAAGAPALRQITMTDPDLPKV